MTRTSDAWPGYVAIATVGYVIYGLGAVVPYLRGRLGLSDAEVGLHSTAMAIGFVLAGLFAARVGDRVGEVAVRASALVLLAVAVLLLAWAPDAVATLVAGVAIGLGAGIVLGYANASLGAPGGSSGRLRLGRANVWAMVAASVAPILFAAGAGSGVGWWIGLLPVLVLVAIDALDLRAGQRLALEGATAGGSLPRTFWFAWVYLVAIIAAEFCIVFWAATLVERRTASSTELATLVAALFFAGMFAGRVGLSLGIGTGGDVRRATGIGLLLVGLGTTAAWLSTVSLVSAAGLFAAGVGMAGLYPLGIAAAIATVPDQLARAGARLTLASGVAVLVAPLALGVVADATGVVAGWTLVIALALVALILSRALPFRSSGSTSGTRPAEPARRNQQEDRDEREEQDLDGGSTAGINLRG
jgi:MFS family permease